MTRIDAPFTPEQVGRLNEWQTCAWVHPFTCANRGDGNHRWLHDLGVLIATTEGWTCPDCDYTQTWAHDLMALGAPPDPFAK